MNHSLSPSPSQSQSQTHSPTKGPQPQKVFINTQYTNLQFPKLISFGACSEFGRMFYAEIEGDWEQENCSDHVREKTLPALTMEDSRLKGSAAAAFFASWLKSLDAGDVELISLHTLDRDLVCGVEGFLAEVGRLGVKVSHRPVARIAEVDAQEILRGIERFFSDAGPAIPKKDSRNHALNGAIALRYAFNLTVGAAEFRESEAERAGD